MGMKTFVVAAGMAVGFSGCAGMENILEQRVNNSIEESGKDNETDEQKQWRWAMEKKPGAASRPKVTDLASFKEAVSAIDGYTAQIQTYKDYNCTETRAKRCDDADAAAAEAAKWQLATYDEAMAVKSIPFDEIQDYVLDFERQKANEGVSIDKWVDEIAARKLEHWSKEISSRGGTLTKWADAQAEPVCVLYSSDPTKSDVKNIDYTFKASDTIWVKCAFTKPPAEFTRNDGDYWRIEIMWASRWESLDLTYDVKKPSASQTVVFSFPANVVGQRIEKKKAATNFLYPGTWLRVRAGYITRYITGQEWRDGKWVDVWKHEDMGGNSAFLKWK